MDIHFLSDVTEQAEVRYISMHTETRRYDVAVLTSPRLEEKNEVVFIDLQGPRYTKINKNHIEDSEYLAHAFNVNEYESDEIYEILNQILNN
ncbi:SAV0927 family protein [Tenuibacillus multivorans]|uniref:DUF3055 domain-containing protein n=1 Tax=Tenuibacillus multivorans TaxID=237069 RepID=A0A1H0FU89_9BACI|nr:SAV0927 family protein [Tenuibacillus multivorans]GEL77883.1 hypothetical protein TMU01_21180 [Tenuibacillus multivorans]SDN98039.1 Protein of unknown function [Tenuibacillus multivorans]